MVAVFVARRTYASAVLGGVILSVRPSVCHTRALLQNQTMHYGYFDTTRKGNHSSFLTLREVGGRRPLLSDICGQINRSPSKNADFDRFLLIISQP